MSTRRRFFAACMAVAITPLVTAALADNAPAKTVALAIDYGDGVQKHFTALPWSEGMSVLDAMKLATAHPRGITFKHAGSGASALLKSIDNVTNEGGGGEARNWQFRINGKYATQGFGVFKLTSGDRVEWRFDLFRPGE